MDIHFIATWCYYANGFYRCCQILDGLVSSHPNFIYPLLNMPVWAPLYGSFTLAKFVAKLLATSCHCLTWLGHLGRRDADRIVSIFCRAARGGQGKYRCVIVALTYTNVNTALRIPCWFRLYYRMSSFWRERISTIGFFVTSLDQLPKIMKMCITFSLKNKPS